MDSAINHFYHCYTQTLKTASNDPSSKAFRKDTDTTFYVARNEIQDRLLASSEQRCDAYKKYLRHLDGSEGFVAGALGTALAGAGSIVTGANTARLFSGLAGISNGIGAEAKQNIFSNLASSVIIPGIQKRRADLLQDMMKKRCHSVATYTVALAIADALKFHAACTMDVGMEESGKTLEAAQNPGLDSLAASLAKFQQVRQQMASALAPQSTSGSGSSGQASATGGTNASAAPTESAQSSMARTSTFEGITIPVDCSVDAIKQFVGMTNAATETSNAPPAGKSDPQVANAQQALNAASVYNLSVDGVLGPKTVAAIRDYQRKKNLPVTGKLDAATLGALKLS